MSDSANYVIREYGRIELYYSRWGALTVAEDVFWGPARTEAFIRNNQSTTEWLDEIWAQGGIALDKDNSRLTYYYYEWPDEEDLRTVYESLLKETWRASTWPVQRVLTWQDFVAALGVDPDVVKAAPTGPALITVDQLGKNLARSCCHGMLSVRKDQDWQHHAVDFCLSGLLMNGPVLIEHLATVADLRRLRAAFLDRCEADSAKTLGDWIYEFCAIDVSTRTLRVSVPEYEIPSIPFVQAAWPGWKLIHGDSGASEHFAYIGCDLPYDLLPSAKPPVPIPPCRSYEECVHLILHHLDANEDRKSAVHRSHIKLIQTLNEKDGPVTVAPGFFNRIPSSKPSLFERLKVMLRLKAKQFWS